MRFLGRVRAVIGICILCSGSSALDVCAAGDLGSGDILKHMGAKGRDAGTAEEIATYQKLFNRLDQEQDGRLSREEYVDNGTYLNPRSRAGIFRASDADVDGLVSREEYVENRRITDEAKAIMAKADTDGDGRVTRMEFVRCFGVERATLAIAIFEKLDTDRDGATVTPEYLRVWGVWARPVAAAESVGGGQYPEARASRGEARQAGPRRGPPSGLGPGGGSTRPSTPSRR